MTRLALILCGTAAALALGGCTYDYLQRTDKVGYSAGDAVKANLEAQTTDPARDSAYSTKGLGKNGYVEPKPPTGGMEAAPAAP
ncbi:MAG: hypothetical protein Q8M47_14955 [Devosia sp.]|nr:hypothetical protein [Devosia sp.]